MGTRCVEGCGQCCDPVAYPASLNELRKLWRPSLDDVGRANVDWILNHFTPISRREGLARTPELTSGITEVIIRGVPDTVITHFYECDAFDLETRSCTAYDDRPPMCTGFPWYGLAPDPTKPLPAECGYHYDVDRQPVPVTITARRR